MIQRLDASINDLLFGRSGGPFGLTLGGDEKAVLRCVRYQRGLANTISIREIEQRTRLNPRTIKNAVRGLRMSFHLPIGSSKSSGGYYLMVTKEDRDAWVNDVVRQMRAEGSVLRAAAGHQAYMELASAMNADAAAQEANR